MPEWTTAYRDELFGQFDGIRSALPTRLTQISEGQTAPALADIAIGSARQMSAAVLFFDIAGSSFRTPSGDPLDLRRTLVTLNCVIPMVSRVVTDHGGYIEKNTGDGLMAIVGAGGSHADAANAALDIAVTSFFVLRTFVNPFLIQNGIEPVNARIGIDYGQLLVARIGPPSGTAAQGRNFLTAIGPAANIANRLQAAAPTNGICIGDAIHQGIDALRQAYCQVWFPSDWHWVFHGTTVRYRAWNYTQLRDEPLNWFNLLLGATQG